MDIILLISFSAVRLQKLFRDTLKNSISFDGNLGRKRIMYVFFKNRQKSFGDHCVYSSIKHSVGDPSFHISRAGLV